MRRLYAAPLPPRLCAAASPRRRLSRVGSRPSSARAAASSIASDSRSRRSQSPPTAQRRPDRRGKYEDADGDRLSRDQVQKCLRGDVVPDEQRDADRRPRDRFECQPSSLGPRERCRERWHTRQNASDQCVHRDDGDDGLQTDVRLQDEYEAEEDGRDAVRCDHFPDAGKHASPSLAASSILLLTFDSKVSVGVDSVVLSSSSVDVQGRLANLPLEVVEHFREAVLFLLPRIRR
jgi:hypothetical protein